MKMFKNLLLTFFLFFSTFITFYPSKKESTNLFEYCYCLEKILSRNSVEESKNLSNKVKTFAKHITAFSTNKTRGDLANKIIEQYKSSKKLSIITFLPNEFYCFAGYWIEEVNPGTFNSIFYEKSKQKVNEFIDIKKDIDKFIIDINSEYKSLKKEINDLF